MPLILLLSRVVEAESPYVHEFMVDIRFSIWGETLVILPIYGTTELMTLPFRRGWGTPWIFSMRNTQKMHKHERKESKMRRYEKAKTRHAYAPRELLVV